MTHLLLGSIGVLVETSDLQRQAFNRAFKAAGLTWHWGREEYAKMLGVSGGQDRIAAYAQKMGDKVDAKALHASKSDLFQAMLSQRMPLRPGVQAAFDTVRASDGRIGFVTTTSAKNVAAILSAAGLRTEEFDLVMDAGQVSRNKPDPEAYLTALDRLDIRPADTVAVEDNPDGVRAAKAAGLFTIAVPGDLHARSSFDHADLVQDTLDLANLQTAA